LAESERVGGNNSTRNL
jgi:hypothetical protein